MSDSPRLLLLCHPGCNLMSKAAELQYVFVFRTEKPMSVNDNMDMASWYCSYIYFIYL